ncbi:hypothetical protein EDB89DRAFT_745893 [Lactarius sanguifluus]|nr:hypothetical protein EDB89DRAFT_745893 [Lactarius sanguifluus]
MYSFNGAVLKLLAPVLGLPGCADLFVSFHRGARSEAIRGNGIWSQRKFRITKSRKSRASMLDFVYITYYSNAGRPSDHLGCIWSWLLQEAYSSRIANSGLTILSMCLLASQIRSGQYLSGGGGRKQTRTFSNAWTSVWMPSDGLIFKDIDSRVRTTRWEGYTKSPLAKVIPRRWSRNVVTDRKELVLGDILHSSRISVCHANHLVATSDKVCPRFTTM